MKKSIVMVTLSLALISTAIAGDYLHGSPGTYQQLGNTTYGSGGTTYQQLGNTTYGSNGNTSQRIGNTTYNSNGSTSQQIGAAFASSVLKNHLV